MELAGPARWLIAPCIWLMMAMSTQYYQILLAQGICSPIGGSYVFYAGAFVLAKDYRQGKLTF